jgi:hypothetical protein
MTGYLEIKLSCSIGTEKRAGVYEYPVINANSRQNEHGATFSASVAKSADALVLHRVERWTCPGRK